MTMTAAAVQSDTIVQEATIAAPAARIFRALTEPEELMKWWTMEGRFQILSAEGDVRPGGRWMIRTKGVCGEGPDSTTVVRGEYRTVEPPHLLIYTWIREEKDHPETTVRWDLEEMDGKTKVRVTHSGLVTERVKERNNGWWMIVKLLGDYAEKGNG